MQKYNGCSSRIFIMLEHISIYGLAVEEMVTGDNSDFFQYNMDEIKL